MDYANSVIEAKQVMDIYEQHKRAVSEYHTACRNFQEVSQRREQAKLQLDKVTQVLSELVTNSMADPTIPQPMNGSAYGSAQAQLQGQQGPGRSF